MIRVIDIETTGIDPAADAIIEIASVDMVRGGGITNAMNTLVRPNKPHPARCLGDPPHHRRRPEGRPAALRRDRPLQGRGCLRRPQLRI